MAKVGSLVVDLTLKSAEFIRDLGKSSQAVARSSNSMQRSLKTMETGFAALFSVRLVKQIISLTNESLKFAASMHGPLADAAQKVLIRSEELQDSFKAGLAKGFLDELGSGLNTAEENMRKATSAGKVMGTVLGATASTLGFVFGTLLPDLANVADRAIQKTLDKLDQLRGQVQELSFTGMQTRLGITEEDTDTVLAYGTAAELAAMAQQSFWGAQVETTAHGEELLRNLDDQHKIMTALQTPVEAYAVALDRIAMANLTGADAARAHSAATAALVGNYLQLADNIGTALGTLFKESKAVAIAQAVINTAQAITKTFAEYGATPWGFALAASMAAIGAAQIASIVSSNPGSSKATKPSKGGATTSATAKAGTSSRGGSFTQAVNIEIIGDVFGPEHFRKIVAGLNDVQRDGTALLRMA